VRWFIRFIGIALLSAIVTGFFFFHSCRNRGVWPKTEVDHLMSLAHLLHDRYGPNTLQKGIAFHSEGIMMSFDPDTPSHVYVYGETNDSTWHSILQETSLWQRTSRSNRPVVVYRCPSSRQTSEGFYIPLPEAVTETVRFAPP